MFVDVDYSKNLPGIWKTTEVLYLIQGGGAGGGGDVETDSFSHNEKFEIAPYLNPECYTRQRQQLKKWIRLQIEFWNCDQVYWTSKIRGVAVGGVVLLYLIFNGKISTSE